MRSEGLTSEWLESTAITLAALTALASLAAEPALCPVGPAVLPAASAVAASLPLETDGLLDHD